MIAGGKLWAELIQLADEELEGVWDRTFAARLLRYPEEECFMQRMAEEFRNKRILSIGSAMGCHEIHYQRCGARITCCDIEETNLEVIRLMKHQEDLMQEIRNRLDHIFDRLP